MIIGNQRGKNIVCKFLFLIHLPFYLPAFFPKGLP
nr:MAG TPA: hypothetical protein [Caudoviricetes sp.]